jgi:outer membrane protein assembly factor BamB
VRLRPALALLLAAVTLTGCSASLAQITISQNIGPGIAGVGTLPTPASAWPEAGYDARRSSATPALGPQTAHVKWTRDLGGNAAAGPVLAANGTVLAATDYGVLHDLDPQTGRDLWSYDGHASYGGDLSTSPAVVAGGIILWPGPNDTLYALSPAGRLLWSRHFAGQVLSPAIGGRDRVYVADHAGHVTALQVTATDHRVLWTTAVGGTDYAGVTISPDGTIFTASNSDLVAIRDLGSSGAVLWRLHAAKPVEVTNAVSAQGTVLLGTDNDKEYGVGTDGTVEWSFHPGESTYSSSVITPAGRGYFGDNSGRLRVVDMATGSVVRTITPLGAGREKIWSEPVVDSRGDIYWATTAGNVYGYTAAARQLWHLAVGAGVESYPALGADGTLYLGTTAGRIYAIGG